MEYFDVIDKKRQPLGYIKQRDETLEDNEYNVGVEIWIFNHHKLLMTQRNITKSHPLAWEVPGGCSQTSETSLETLLREIKEEINIDFDPHKCHLIATKLYKKQFVDIYVSNELIAFSQIQCQENEIRKAKFVTYDEFIEMINKKKIVLSVLERYKLIANDIKENWS